MKKQHNLYLDVFIVHRMAYTNTAYEKKNSINLYCFFDRQKIIYKNFRQQET